MKKAFYTKIGIIVLFLFFIMTLSLSIFYFNEMNSVKKKIANYNYLHWYDLYNFTSNIEDYVNTVDDTTHYGLYVNSNIYRTVDYLIPSFNGESSATFRFLCVSYDPLFQDLARKSIPEQHLQQGLELFLRMNDELSQICAFVVNDENDSEKIKLEIVNDKSSIHREIQSTINAFCQKYSQEISNFYQAFN